MENYSVLMSVYVKENPIYFKEAIQSMLGQTFRTNDFVIVCDGPLTNDLDDVLEEFATRYPEIFNIIRLDQNVGIGAAANIGFKCCKNNLIAKMDGDDISLPDRCEKQVKRFEECPKLSLLGGQIEEFDDNPAEPFSVRSVPCDYEGIKEFARRRQPFNNVTVMYRQNAVLTVGGYRSDLRRCEDFDLYLRMLHNGFYAENIKDVLVKVRVKSDAFARRGSWDTLKGFVSSRWYSFRIGYASFVDVLICLFGEMLIIISPKFIRRFIYNHFLRKKCVENGKQDCF